MRVIGAMRRPTTSILGRNNFRSNTGRSGDENDEFNDFDYPLYWMGDLFDVRPRKRPRRGSTPELRRDARRLVLVPRRRIAARGERGALAGGTCRFRIVHPVKLVERRQLKHSCSVARHAFAAFRIRRGLRLAGVGFGRGHRLAGDGFARGHQILEARLFYSRRAETNLEGSFVPAWWEKGPRWSKSSTAPT